MLKDGREGGISRCKRPHLVVVRSHGCSCGVLVVRDNIRRWHDGKVEVGLLWSILAVVRHGRMDGRVIIVMLGESFYYLGDTALPLHCKSHELRSQKRWISFKQPASPLFRPLHKLTSRTFLLFYVSILSSKFWTKFWVRRRAKNKNKINYLVNPKQNYCESWTRTLTSSN